MKVPPIPEEAQKFYDKLILDMANVSCSWIMLPKIIGYKNVKQRVYLHIPYPKVWTHYDDEYGDYEGLLMTLEWWNTKIPLWKKTVQEPIYEPIKSKKIKWVRYNWIPKE